MKKVDRSKVPEDDLRRTDTRARLRIARIAVSSSALDRIGAPAFTSAMAWATAARSSSVSGSPPGAASVRRITSSAETATGGGRAGGMPTKLARGPPDWAGKRRLGLPLLSPKASQCLIGLPLPQAPRQAPPRASAAGWSCSRRRLARGPRAPRRELPRPPAPPAVDAVTSALSRAAAAFSLSVRPNAARKGAIISGGGCTMPSRIPSLDRQGPAPAAEILG
jgi:hypothetical protein